jgi:hypothetical protein
MSAKVTIEPAAGKPAGLRSVPLLWENDLGHYAEFRDFLAAAFDLARDPFGPPGLLSVDGRLYELVFSGRSGRPFPASVAVDALVEGLEPLDQEAADRDLWAILGWLVEGVGEPWTREGLVTSGQIFRVPAAMDD